MIRHKGLRYCLRIQEIWLIDQKDDLWSLSTTPVGNSPFHSAYGNQLTPGGWMNLFWKFCFLICKYFQKEFYWVLFKVVIQDISVSSKYPNHFTEQNETIPNTEKNSIRFFSQVNFLSKRSFKVICIQNLFGFLLF